MSDFSDKVRTVGVVGRTPTSRDVRDGDGRLVGRETVDENNTIITERDNGVDVTIRPKPASVKVIIGEPR
jgi:hypothetical protein